MTVRQRVAFSALWTLTALAGCTTRIPVEPQRVVGIPPARVIESIVAREQGIRTLRARFHSTATFGGEQRSASGILVVSKPSRFRMRLMTAFGLTVFDYLQRDGRSFVSQPVPSSGNDGDRLKIFSERGMGGAFLSRFEIDPEACRIDGALAQCDEGSGRRLTFDLDKAVLVEDRQAEVLLRYGDHRAEGGTVLPFRIDIRTSIEGTELAVDVEVDRYELNPELPEALFAPPASSR